MMSKETKFKITAKYIQQDYNITEDILSELAIHPVVKKIQNYRTKWKHFQRMDRETTTPNYVISTMWEVKPRMTPQKTSKLLKEPEQVTRPKTLQAI